MNFQYIVIIVAIIIYLVVAGFIGYGIYKSQNSIQWPPFSSSCPDYWTLNDKDSDPDKGSCVNPNRSDQPAVIYKKIFKQIVKNINGRKNIPTILGAEYPIIPIYVIK